MKTLKEITLEELFLCFEGKVILYTEESDAALIAAAPDLLRVCKELVQCVEVLEYPTLADMRRLEEARATIARAEKTKGRRTKTKV